MDTLKEVCGALLKRVLCLRDAETGVWAGELASSALGTALAVAALEAGDASDRARAAAGAAWLVSHANEDGGWGDTPESLSNLSTTLIVSSALGVVSQRRRARGDGNGGESRDGRNLGDGRSDDGMTEAIRRAEAWIVVQAGSLEPAAVAKALTAVYGKDRTFAVPILAFLAMCGEDARAWLSVPPLPFLLALLPQGLYRFFRLQVVSYALPALIAVGLCRHVCVSRARGRPAWGRLFAPPLLRRLAALQPAHGGFLDAIPLTAFVSLSLRQAGYGAHPVARKGLAFLRGVARGDGSWAIDSNLRTWVTALAVRSVSVGGMKWDSGDMARLAAWFVAAQTKTRHPFTGAPPGGWAWTDLPGGVPDADDTSGVLIALRRLVDSGCAADVSGAVRAGMAWLLNVQNADGGMPTFCRGWGRLPFDRSCPDISAHALAALTVWGGEKASGGREEAEHVSRATVRLIRYLERSQEADGSWVPLWFGHQAAKDGKNPVVGTARVVEALRAVRGGLDVRCEALGVGEMLANGERWLVGAQHPDGGWGMGGEATVEETSLAVSALAGGGAACSNAARRGCAWLLERGCAGLEKTAPIGLYFALLWYHERLYPLVWALEALGRNLKEKEDEHDG